MDDLDQIDPSELAEFFNSEFGNDISNLKNAQVILDELKKSEKDIRNKLNPHNKDDSEIAHFSETGDSALKEISHMLKKYDNLQTLINSQIQALKPMKDCFLTHINNLKELENAHSYLQWLSAIDTENNLMEEALKQNLTSEIITHFEIFKAIWYKLRSSDCKHLVKYSDDTMVYWHNILKENFGREYQKNLEGLHWPRIATPLSKLKVSPDSLIKFENLFSTLCKIQLPEEYNVMSNEGKQTEPFLLPLEMLFEPLEKRFYFHFMTKKLTNRIDKPEWYLAQVLTWMSDHQLFLKKTVQPLLQEKNFYYVQAFDELMRCLVQLAIARFKKDLPSLLEADDSLLGHTIDEIFLFERELKNQDYPKSYPTLINVLSTEPCFSRWQSLEHKSALEKMDRLLSSEAAWKSRYLEEEDLDDLQVPECAEMFITLLSTMTERYRYNLSDEQQASFMGLQLELLDDFRLRLHQLSQYQVEETLDAKYCAILNAVNYITIVLYEWSNLPFYLKLYTFMQKASQLSNEKNDVIGTPKRKRLTDSQLEDEKLDGSVFDEPINLFEHVQKDLIQILCERVLLDIKAKSRSYRKEKWFCMPTVHDKKTLEVSPFAYPLLDVINTSLLSLCDLLAKSLFTTVWQHIAKELNVYLYEEVILQNSFSEGGAEQLHFDMSRNLFPIFGCYTIKPENYFRLVKESCILLTLSAAPAILVKDTLKEQEKLEDRLSTLAELGVHNLTPQEALVILSQRNDLTT